MNTTEQGKQKAHCEKCMFHVVCQTMKKCLRGDIVLHEEPSESLTPDREGDTPAVTKLSQAIREGCKHHPKAVGSSWDGTGTCAIGAAYVGIGHEPNDSYLTCWAVLQDAGIAPIRGMLPCDIHEKNDSLGWSRERIADWLESKGY